MTTIVLKEKPITLSKIPATQRARSVGLTRKIPVFPLVPDESPISELIGLVLPSLLATGELAARCQFANNVLPFAKKCIHQLIQYAQLSRLSDGHKGALQPLMSYYNEAPF